MSVDAWPLQWPQGWKRTSPSQRREAKFGKARQGTGASYVAPRGLTITEAVQRLLDELERLPVRTNSVVISTNVRPTLGGLPRSGERKPDDPGAACYWTDAFNGKPRVMAIDQYTRVEDNIAALAATIEAMRAIERHGGAVILERAFTGFTALPAPGQGAKRKWWDVLLHRHARGVQASLPPAGQQVPPRQAWRQPRGYVRTQCGAGSGAAGGIPMSTSTAKTEQALTREAMKPGARYNWKNQPDRLVYLGRYGGWHQFRKIGDPRDVWCEVLDADLHMLEETAAAPTPSVPLTDAARDMLAERQRQIEELGWLHDHDDEYEQGELAFAASCYAVANSGATVPPEWPWPPEWWKPKDRRLNLVRAAALLLAEIERLDRAAAAHQEKP